MSAIYMRYPGGKAKAFTTSYDDGVSEDARLIARMKEYGIRGTFNLNAGLFRPEDKPVTPGKYGCRMSRAEAIAVYADSGMEIAVHGYEHPFLESLPRDMMLTQLYRDREVLEQTFGTIIRGCVLPYGTANREVYDAIRACGFAYCRGVGNGDRGFSVPQETIPFIPTTHHANPELGALLDRFLGMDTLIPRLFYLWGHAYEFPYDREGNSWSAIEAAFARVGGQSDVWYATNLEIFDYVTAYKRLGTSLDGTILHNPTATEIWFCRDGQTASIRPGETLRF